MIYKSFGYKYFEMIVCVEYIRLRRLLLTHHFPSIHVIFFLCTMYVIVKSMKEMRENREVGEKENVWPVRTSRRVITGSAVLCAYCK